LGIRWYQGDYCRTPILDRAFDGPAVGAEQYIERHGHPARTEIQARIQHIAFIPGDGFQI